MVGRGYQDKRLGSAVVLVLSACAPTKFGGYGTALARKTPPQNRTVARQKFFVPKSQGTPCGAEAKMEASPLHPRRFLQAGPGGHGGPKKIAGHVE